MNQKFGISVIFYKKFSFWNKNKRLFLVNIAHVRVWMIQTINRHKLPILKEGRNIFFL
jgi:ribosomal protein L28